MSDLGTGLWSPMNMYAVRQSSSGMPLYLGSDRIYYESQSTPYVTASVKLKQPDLDLNENSLIDQVFRIGRNDICYFWIRMILLKLFSICYSL